MQDMELLDYIFKKISKYMDSNCADIAEKKEIHARGKAHYSITVLKWRKSISQIHFFHKIEKSTVVLNH